MTFGRRLVVLPPLAFLGVFYFYPLWAIFKESFWSEAGLRLAPLAELVSGGYYAGVAWFTFWQATVSTLLTLVLALPAAYVFARYDFWGKRVIQSLTLVPFVLPTVVTAAAFRALLGPGGLVNQGLTAWFGLKTPPIQLEHTVWFILLAHVFYNYTVFLRLVGGFWARLPRDLPDAARMLGADHFQVFRRVTWPLLTPAILAASLLVFIFCFTSFGVVLILGGPKLATLEVEIYRQALHMFNLPLAASLSLIQILFTLAVMALYTTFERRASVSLIPEDAGRAGRRPRTRAEKGLLAASLGSMALLLSAPIAALFLRSVFTADGLSLKYYAALFHNPAQSILYVAPSTAVVNSLLFALAAMCLALGLGWLAAAYLSGGRSGYGDLLDPVFMLPLSTSAVTLGFGFILALDEPPLNLRTSLMLPAVAHALVAFPFVLRSLLPAMRGIPQNLRDAAAMLGASPWQVWRYVDLPILTRALLVGAVFAAAVSLGEFGATVFTARPDTPTMPVAIFRLLGQPGAMNYGQAMAMSCLLMLTTAAAFLLLEGVKAKGRF